MAAAGIIRSVAEHKAAEDVATKPVIKPGATVTGFPRITYMEGDDGQLYKLSIVSGSLVVAKA